MMDDRYSCCGGLLSFPCWLLGIRSQHLLCQSQRGSLPCDEIEIVSGIKSSRRLKRVRLKMIVWFDSRTISSPTRRATAQREGLRNTTCMPPTERKQHRFPRTLRTMLDHNEKKCVYCGSTELLTIDHYIPKSRGGTSDRSNQVLSCNDCNADKGSDLPLNFVWRRVNGTNQHGRQDSRDLSGKNTK